MTCLRLWRKVQQHDGLVVNHVAFQQGHMTEEIPMLTVSVSLGDSLAVVRLFPRISVAC